jgi:hypothetical protein
MDIAERNLWRAVLNQAYEDAEEPPFCDDGQLTVEASRARSYLRGDDPVEAEHLAFVCDLADMPADRIVLWARRQYPAAA